MSRFYWSDDPLRDFDRHDADQQRKLERMPKCAECRDHIQQKDAVCIKGKFYCDECLKGMREHIGD